MLLTSPIQSCRNECSRNYFDPLMDEEINPRQCGMEVSKEALVKSDERFLYDKLVQFLDEEKKMVVSHEMKAEEIDGKDALDSAWPVSCSKTSDRCDEVEDEDILPYVEQFEKEVHNEVILLGNFPLKQDIPVRKNGKPGEILLFELVLLQGTSDRIVGWGAFPLYNNNLDIVDGKFKCPLLRGHYDSRIDRFQKIEKLISSDLDHWLCNLYFQIIKLPWYSNEQYEYEMGLQPSSKFLQYSSPAEKNGISKKEIIEQPLTPRRDSDTHKGSIPTVEKEVRRRFNVVKGGERCILEKTQKKITNHLMDSFQQMKQNDPNDVVVQSSSRIRPDADDGVLQSYQEELEKHKFSVCCHPAVDAKVSTRLTKHICFGVYGVFSELGRGHWYSWDFWSSVLLISVLWFIRLYLHYFSQWILLQVFAVPVTKFQFYLYTVDLCYQNSLVHASEEMAMVVVGPLTLNTVMLLWILMRWGCQLLFGSFPSYLSKLIMAWGFWTVLDPLAVFVADAFLGRLHYAADNPTADCAKLYWLFLRTEETGIPGALITVLLYAVLFLFSSATLHLYWLRLYNESWLLDLLQRIQGDETSFFVPCDLEISIQELSYLVKKAEQWRGLNGERRKVVVYECFWEDHAKQPEISCHGFHPQGEILKFAGNSRGITIHVMIYTVHLGGFQELYRHFLRLPSGAIVETFGDVSGINFAWNEVTSDFEEHRSGMDPLLEASSEIKK
ncbi:uncharacterized protein PHA67_015976 [Liasis olivaceus]